MSRTYLSVLFILFMAFTCLQCSKKHEGSLIKNTTWTIVNASNKTIIFYDYTYEFRDTGGNIIEYGNYSYVDFSIIFQRTSTTAVFVSNSKKYTLSLRWPYVSNIMKLEGTITFSGSYKLSWLLIKN